MQAPELGTLIAKDDFTDSVFIYTPLVKNFNFTNIFTAVEEMKRSVHDLSLPGFQIGSHIGDWNLDSPELYPIYKVSKSCFIFL